MKERLSRIFGMGMEGGFVEPPVSESAEPDHNVRKTRTEGSKTDKLTRRAFVIGAATAGAVAAFDRMGVGAPGVEGKRGVEREVSVELDAKVKEAAEYYLQLAPADRRPQDAREQKEYLAKMLTRHLELDLGVNGFSEQLAQNPEQFYETALSPNGDKVCREKIVERFTLAREIQQVIAERMIEAGISKEAAGEFLRRPLDAFGVACGRRLLGLGDGSFLPNYLLDRADIVDLLKKAAAKGERLPLTPIDFSEKQQAYASKVLDRLDATRLSILEEKNPEAVAKQFKSARELIAQEKARLVLSRMSDADREKAAEALLATYITFLVEAWQYSPATSQEGDAKRPFSGISDCTTFVL